MGSMVCGYHSTNVRSKSRSGTKKCKAGGLDAVKAGCPGDVGARLYRMSGAKRVIHHQSESASNASSSFVAPSA